MKTQLIFLFVCILALTAGAMIVSADDEFPGIHNAVGTDSHSGNLSSTRTEDDDFSKCTGGRFTTDFRSTMVLDTTQLDSFIAAKMTEYDVPGVSAVAVRDGQILWTGSYGYANIASETPVTDTTLFTIGSVSKLFPAVALMQLWEEDMFELDDDINDYLTGFQVMNPLYPGTITFRHVLTHTSSIVDNPTVMIDTWYWGGDSPIPLGEYLADYFTPGGEYYDELTNFSHQQPGVHYIYANTNAALCAFLVEEITGIPFYQYSYDSIMTPLGMDKSGWFLADINLDNLATGYEDTGPISNYGYPDYPAGSLRTNILQLSKFLIALMQKGEVDGVRILDSTTVDTMTATHFVVEGAGSREQGLIIYKLFYFDKWITGHYGGPAGGSTVLFYLADDNSGIIILNNKHGTTNFNFEIGHEIFAFANAQLDGDGDGYYDISDNCSGLSNPGQEDIDEDGVGDVCDNCPAVANQDQVDTDQDGPGDACDNCPFHDNPGQEDADSDGVGDICDLCPGFDDKADIDADGIPDDCDNCPAVANEDQVDTDQDGPGDACDNCPFHDNLGQEDADSDGVGDICDLCPGFDDKADIDADGIPDDCDNCGEVYNPGQEDSDENGIGDACQYLCGDADGDDALNVSDAVHLVNYIFKGGLPPDPLCAGDTNDDDAVNIGDAVYLIAYIFKGGPPPVENCCP